MRFTLRWVGVVLTATVVDLLLRFWGMVSFTWVLRLETILFPLTGLALGLIFKSHPRPSRAWRGLQVGAVWAFFLAGLRTGIWAAGFPVSAANLVTFSVALLASIGFWISRRRDARKRG